MLRHGNYLNSDGNETDAGLNVARLGGIRKPSSG